jgi:hypothetical protein
MVVGRKPGTGCCDAFLPTAKYSRVYCHRSSLLDPDDHDSIEHRPTNTVLKGRVYRDGKDHRYISSIEPSPTYQDTGNKVSRRATIAGPQNIILGGKTIISSGAIIRGDLRRTGPGHAVVISLGRYCLVGEGCIMR